MLPNGLEMTDINLKMLKKTINEINIIELLKEGLWHDAFSVYWRNKEAGIGWTANL